MARTAELPMAPTAEDVYEKIAPLLGPHDRDQVLEELGKALACPECGGPLTSFCPRERGRAGGATASPAKLKALAEARKKRWPSRRRKKRGT